MSNRRMQLVFGPDNLVELMVRQGSEIRTITIDLFGAPVAQAGLGDPAVGEAVFAWAEAEQLPPWIIGWEELEPMLVSHGLDVEALVDRHPA